jgi:hypothetical protein
MLLGANSGAIQPLAKKRPGPPTEGAEETNDLTNAVLFAVDPFAKGASLLIRPIARLAAPLARGLAEKLPFGIGRLLGVGTARRGDNLPPIAGGAAVTSVSGRLKQAMLPTRGRIRYVPPKRYNPNDPLPQGERGYLDRFGNEWVRGPSRTPGESFEWDVQLSEAGRRQLEWLSRDGRHINVNRRGQVTHR